VAKRFANFDAHAYDSGRYVSKEDSEKKLRKAHETARWARISQAARAENLADGSVGGLPGANPAETQVAKQ
jgi:hypothetical protein